MESVKVSLSQNQLSKIKRGQPIQISAAGLKGGNLVLKLQPNNMKKVKRAIKNSKGVRIQLSNEEIEGSGILDLLKKGAKIVKKGFDITKKTLGKKKTRELLTQGIRAASKLAPAAVSHLADEYADDLVNWVGDKTGAFGIIISSKFVVEKEEIKADLIITIQKESMKFVVDQLTGLV